MFNPEITIGSILTSVTILLSIVGLIITWQKDQQFKKKEYADRIRRAAGTIRAKLERWKEISLHFFDSVQEFFFDVDRMITKEKDSVEARDYLCRNLASEHKKFLQQILDEMIETAYIDLYGYDSGIRSFFVDVIKSLRATDRNIYSSVVLITQVELILLCASEESINSGKLGNILRTTSGNIADAYRGQMESIIEPFHKKMVELICLSDNNIVDKSISLSSTEKILPPPSNMHLHIDQSDYIKACETASEGRYNDALNIIENATMLSPLLKGVLWDSKGFTLVRNEQRFKEICQPEMVYSRPN